MLDLSFTHLLLLILLGLILWFWQDSLRARERAKQACQQICRSYGVQFLDDTVALDHIWLRRNANGRLRMERRYTFEFSGSGADRSAGVAILFGVEVEVLALDGSDLFIP